MKKEIDIKFTETKHESTTKAFITQADIREQEDAKQYAVRRDYGDRRFEDRGDRGGFDRDRPGFERDNRGGFDRDRPGFERGDRGGFGSEDRGDPYEDKPYQPFKRNTENPDFRTDAPAAPVARPQENTGFRRSDIQQSSEAIKPPTEQPSSGVSGWRNTSNTYVSPAKDAAAPSGPRQSRFKNSAKSATETEPTGKANAWR